MYWISKIFQAAGLAIMGLGIIQHFPNLMPYGVFILSGVFFIVGWFIQKVAKHEP